MELEPAANARWHKNQQIEMELRRTVSSVTLNSNPVSDEGVYICAVTHSRIDHSPVVVCVCLGTDFGRLQPALYSGVAHGISEDVHELWVVHRANVNARLSDFLLDHTRRFQRNSGQWLLGDCSARSCRPKREHAWLTDSWTGAHATSSEHSQKVFARPGAHTPTMYCSAGRWE